ncbi:MAG: 6-carboxytetrahydropterin synthase QueD [Gammaproteobacteria bacterium]
MSARYTVKILVDFASAHTLRDYPGECRRMHGHNWKVEVEAVATELDKIGMAIDFKVVKQAARELAARLDHRYLNEITPFDTVNPTAENIAAWFYRELGRMLNSPRVRISAVTLWETERACVRYTEEETI